VLRAVPFDPIRALFDPEFAVSGCYLVPSYAARERIGAEHVKYSSQRNGRGPHAWNHHWLLVPLYDRNGDEMGFIWADDPEDRLIPSAERLQALRVFANQATTALYAAEQFEQMRFLADHDPLTNLLNRRSFVQHLDAEVARSRRYNRPLALVIFDLDELKAVNDTQGHAAGDEALKRVADALRATIRAEDNAFRLGGDEFAVLLVEANANDAAAVAQRIADGLQLGASFGVGVCTSDGDARTLLREADDAMYRMKRRRRAERLGDDLSAVV
jgi:diguanylate cyclase (GGDEF)-like protein